MDYSNRTLMDAELNPRAAALASRSKVLFVLYCSKIATLIDFSSVS